MQEQEGVREAALRAGRKLIRGDMPEPHRDFFATLPFLFVGSMDAGGFPWASILAGRPGFVTAPSPRTLRVAARPLPGDPLGANLRAGAPAGLLGIAFETRRRSRANGRVADVTERWFTLAVEQSFGNCARHIAPRVLRFVADPHTPGGRVRTEGPVLSASACDLVRRADTFFIASATPGSGGCGPAWGADVSHRGGQAGFVHIGRGAEGNVLTFPDFDGNRFFSTLGNLLLNPKAGLLFLDFAEGHVLMLTGTAGLFRGTGADAASRGGAGRFVRFGVSRGVHIEAALPLRWAPPSCPAAEDGRGPA